MPAAIAIPAIIGAAGIGTSVATGFMGANAANNAANTQANAAIQAAQIQANEADKALGFQEGQYGNALNLEAPYIQSGQSALANLDYLLGTLPSAPSSGPAGSGALVSPGNPNSAQSQINGKGPRYGPNVITQHGTAMQYFRSNGPYDIYRPYTANSQLANNQSDWFVNQNGKWMPYSSVPQAAVTTQGQAVPGGASSVAGSLPQVNPVNLNSLVNPSIGKEGSLLAPINPDVLQQDPGYLFRLQQAQKAIQNSASARGTLFTGGTAKALDRFSQDYASNEFTNVYNRYWQDRLNTYNMLANQAGLGQVSTGQAVGAGQNTGNSLANILLTSGQQQGNALQNAAAARASGYVGGANAIGGAIGGGVNTLSNLLLLSQIMGQNQNQNTNDQGVANSFPT